MPQFFEKVYKGITFPRFAIGFGNLASCEHAGFVSDTQLTWGKPMQRG